MLSIHLPTPQDHDELSARDHRRTSDGYHPRV